MGLSPQKKIEDFKLPLFENKEMFTLSEGLKDKKVVLNFWASWCIACINEIGELEELKKKYNDKYHFIGVNVGEKSFKIKKFITRHNFSYKIITDKEKKLVEKLNITELPRTIVVDSDLTILYSGEKPPKKL